MFLAGSLGSCRAAPPLAAPEADPCAESAFAVVPGGSGATDPSNRPNPTPGFDSARFLEENGAAELRVLSRVPLVYVVVRGDVPRLERAAVGKPIAIQRDSPVRAASVQTKPAGDHGWALGTLDDTDGNGDPESFAYRSCPAAVELYVVDSGVWKDQSDIAGRVVCDGEGCPEDRSGHGTHMAQVAAGTTRGAGKLAAIHPIAVLDAKGDGCATQAALALGEIIAASAPRKIANLSFVGPESPALDQEVSLAVEAGVVVVAAAGNTAADVDTLSPAGAEAALTVAGMSGGFGEVGDQGFGAGVDLFAPNGPTDVGAASASQPQASGTYSVTGNSLSAAYVSGVAAAVWSLHPRWSGAEVGRALLSAAPPLGNVVKNLDGEPVSPHARQLYTRDLLAADCEPE